MASGVIACQAIVHEMLIHQELSGSSLHARCRAADPFLPEVLLLACACVSGHGAPRNNVPSPGVSRMKELMDKVWSYQTHTYLVHKDSPLLSGEDVMNTLGLTPGQQVGNVLRIIEMARADGTLHTRRDALDYLLTIDL